MCTYNPHAVNRKVRIVEQRGSSVQLVSKSMTNPENDDRYKPIVNLATGQVFCQCGDFTNRKSKNNPNIYSPDSDLCKHLVRALHNKRIANQIPPKCCHVCGAVEGELFPVIGLALRFVHKACAKPKPQVDYFALYNED